MSFLFFSPAWGNTCFPSRWLLTSSYLRWWFWINTSLIRLIWLSFQIGYWTVFPPSFDLKLNQLLSYYCNIITIFSCSTTLSANFSAVQKLNELKYIWSVHMWPFKLPTKSSGTGCIRVNDRKRGVHRVGSLIVSSINTYCPQFIGSRTGPLTWTHSCATWGTMPSAQPPGSPGTQLFN